jgi:hypothetical protein
LELLLSVIVLWLSSNFDLPPDMRHPRVEIVSGDELTSRRLLNPAKAPSYQNEELEAVYKDDAQTIYLLHGWTSQSIKDVSVLVHEMVHHLQLSKNERYSCPAEREKLAYEAQEKWLSQFGKSLESEFGLDPFSLLVKSLCN